MSIWILHTEIRSSTFLLVVWVEINSIKAKPYVPQKSWFQWICSKFFGFWHGHNYFWPTRLWRLLEAKNVIASAHFGVQVNAWFIPQCHFCLPKEIKSNPNVYQYMRSVIAFSLHIWTLTNQVWVFNFCRSLSLVLWHPFYKITTL